jgi:protease I
MSGFVLAQVSERSRYKVMAKDIQGKRVAILATVGVEQVELTEPKKALERAGATAEVISPESGKIRAWNIKDWGTEIPVDKTLSEANPDDYDALMLPGGVINPDKLRINVDAVTFVRHFVETDKPIAAICHGPWTLIEAGGVRGKRMTSWPSLRTDLSNAGAEWVDEQVVTDLGLVTSRKPDDIPAFIDKMTEEFAEGQRSRVRTASPE